MAEMIAEEQLKPLAQRVADEAEPRTKEATQQYLRDPAKQVAEQVRCREGALLKLSCPGTVNIALAALLTYAAIQCCQCIEFRPITAQ